MRTLFLRSDVDPPGKWNGPGSLHLWHPIAPSRGLEVMLSKALEEGANRLDMSYRIGIEPNDIVEVCRHLFQVLNHLIDHLHEPPRRSAAALRHNEPLGEALLP